MAEEFLYSADVVAALEEVGGEGMAEGMGCDAFGDAGGACCFPDGLLEAAFVGVVAAHDLTPGPSPRGRGAQARVNGKAVGGKDVLPDPLPAG